MRFIKRFLSLGTALCLALTVLAGCAATGNDNVTPPVTDQVTESPAVTTTEATTTEATTTEATTAATEATTTEATTEATTTEATSEATTTEATAEVTTTEAETKVEYFDKVLYKYAKSSVNVRTEPNADSDRVGHLDEGDKVTVIGRAENGWFLIEFKDGEHFVSDKYLVDEYIAPEADEKETKPEEIKNSEPENKTYSVSMCKMDEVAGAGAGEGPVNYNSDGSAYIENVTIVGWAIPEVRMGETVTVRIKGHSEGEFRMWLLGGGQATASNIVTSAELGFNSGDFDFEFELVAEDHDSRSLTEANAFAIKAPSWNTKIAKLTVKSIEIEYLGSASQEIDDSASKPTSASADTHWLASWGSAQLRAGDDKLPKNISLRDNTVRLQIRPTVGGNKLRLEFSNEFGKTALEINKATLADLIDPKKSDIDTSTLTNITFGGKQSVTIGAGKKIVSDEIDFSFSSLEDLAVTLHLGNVPTTVTSHTNSRCSIWVAKGDQTGAKSISGEVVTSWYFLSALEVLADKDTRAIVCLGDSLTDGASVTNDAFSRWTDELARQLNKNGYSDYSVINMGIGATPLNRLWGDSGVERFNRDVLNVEGVGYLIIFYGVNDIGGANSDISGDIINTYKDMIKKAHAQGIKVYGMTLTPFKDSGYYSELHEKIRLKVNDFIMSKDSGFDGYIDASSAVCDANDSAKIRKSFVSVWNDNLHFNDTGYKFVGKTVFESIKDDLK